MAEKLLAEKLAKFYQHQVAQHSKIVGERKAQEEFEQKLRDERRSQMLSRMKGEKDKQLSEERLQVDRWRATMDKQRLREEGERRFREKQGEQQRRLASRTPPPLPDELPFVKESLEEASAYLDRLRGNREATEKAKEEHEKRRRAVLAEQQNFREAAEQEEQGRRLVEALSRRSKDEQDISDHLERSLAHIDVIRLNAEHWKQETTRASEVFRAAAKARQEASFLQLLEKASREICVELRKFRDCQRGERARLRSELTTEIEQTISDLLERVVFPTVQLRATANDRKFQEIFLADAIEHFVGRKEEVAVPATSVLARLALQLQHALVPEVPRIFWPGAHGLRIAISGPPFSGKSALAQELVTAFPGLAMIEFERVAASDSGRDPMELVVAECMRHIDGGFVLVGFPDTAEQLRRLEETLTLSASEAGALDVHFLMNTGLEKIFHKAIGRYSETTSERNAKVEYHVFDAPPNLTKVDVASLAPVNNLALAQQVFASRSHCPAIARHSREFRSPVGPRLFVVEDGAGAVDAAVEYVRKIADFNDAEISPIVEVLKPVEFAEVEAIDGRHAEFLRRKLDASTAETLARTRRVAGDERRLFAEILAQRQRLLAEFVAVASDASLEPKKSEISSKVIEDWNEFVGEYADLATTEIAKNEYVARLTAAQLALLDLVETRRRDLDRFLAERKDNNSWLLRSRKQLLSLALRLLTAALRDFQVRVSVLKDAAALARGDPLLAQPSTVQDVVFADSSDFEAAVSLAENSLSAQVTVVATPPPVVTVTPPPPPKGGKAKAAPPPEGPRPAAAATVFDEAVEEERGRTRAEVEKIKSWFAKKREEATDLIESLWSSMEELTLARRLEEAKAVEQFGQRMRTHIGESTPAERVAFPGSKLTTTLM